LNVLLFGATGMVGAGALLECLDAPEVKSVLVVGRRPCGVVHPKVREVLLDDLFDIGSIGSELADRDACFFCLGVSAVGMAEGAYRRVTYDLTLTVARTLLAAAPKAVFLYVSGEGTDSTERGRAMWARVKGKTENDLRGLGFREAFMFRPGFIQPLRGVRSRTGWYQAIYTVLGPATPLLRRLAPNLVTTTVDLGRAMIRVAATGYPKRILATRDINEVASLGAGR
jgi:uncharacterized protein YbjT (DUF2867 family)